MFGWLSGARGPRLLLEAAQALGIGREDGGQHLDRDVAPEPRVARAVDLAHPARAERDEDLVGAEARCRRASVITSGSVARRKDRTGSAS